MERSCRREVQPLKFNPGEPRQDGTGPLSRSRSWSRHDDQSPSRPSLNDGCCLCETVGRARAAALAASAMRRVLTRDGATGGAHAAAGARVTVASRMSRGGLVRELLGLVSGAEVDLERDPAVGVRGRSGLPPSGPRPFRGEDPALVTCSVPDPVSVRPVGDAWAMVRNSGARRRSA